MKKIFPKNTPILEPLLMVPKSVVWFETKTRTSPHNGEAFIEVKAFQNHLLTCLNGAGRPSSYLVINSATTEARLHPWSLASLQRHVFMFHPHQAYVTLCSIHLRLSESYQSSKQQHKSFFKKTPYDVWFYVTPKTKCPLGHFTATGLAFVVVVAGTDWVSRKGGKSPS